MEELAKYSSKETWDNALEGFRKLLLAFMQCQNKTKCLYQSIHTVHVGIVLYCIVEPMGPFVEGYCEGWLIKGLVEFMEVCLWV